MNQIFIVGTGPGKYDGMTMEAVKALESSDVIVGYTLYVDLVRDLFPGKEFLTTPMRMEKDRCRLAFEEAEKGKNVSLVCSGDAGIYGLAELMYKMRPLYPDTGLQIVPGVTSAVSGAALLGAPLTNDFCVISLSDLLTPWETIEKRLRGAAAGDFVICLYNPSSRKRKDHFRKACGILLETRSPRTVCGTARQIGREGEETALMTLSELADSDVDMLTTVFVGNSETTVIDGKMVTPRGYPEGKTGEGT